MRQNLTYIILGLVGLIMIKIFEKQITELSGISKAGLIILGLISIPIIEFFINRQYHLKEKLKTATSEEIEKLLNLKPKKKIEEFRSNAPSPPIPFGRKCTWITVKSNSIDEVLSEFKYSKKVNSNWELGVNATFENINLKFISPPVENWILILINNISKLNSTDSLNLMNALSLKFEEAYLFRSSRGTGSFTWSKFKNGEEIRSFELDDGEYYSKGNLTIMESKILEAEIQNRESIQHILGSEENVLKMAEFWSINPINFNSVNEKGIGYLID